MKIKKIITLALSLGLVFGGIVSVSQGITMASDSCVCDGGGTWG